MKFLLVVFLLVTHGTFCFSAQERTLFLCTGAVSGDHLGAWYCKELKKQGVIIKGQAIGGNAMQQEGITLLQHFNDLQATHLTAAAGIFTRLFRLPSVFSRASELARTIVDQHVDEVVLIDFPFFNLPLARALKKIDPHLKVTYIAPPELWFWRSWGMHYFLTWYCDEIIVLYPFEKQWYHDYLGLKVTWMGYPFYEKLHNYTTSLPQRQLTIALLPGSRTHEITGFLPMLAQFAASFLSKHPEVSYILPLAETIPLSEVMLILEKYQVQDRVRIITDQHEKYTALASCCFAITKPGTITLELALLKTPSLVLCKVGWITYWLSWLMVRQKYVSLPNIFLQQSVFTELIQGDCSLTRLMKEAEKLYASFIAFDEAYHQKKALLDRLDQQFQVG